MTFSCTQYIFEALSDGLYSQSYFQQPSFSCVERIKSLAGTGLCVWKEGTVVKADICPQGSCNQAVLLLRSLPTVHCKACILAGTSTLVSM